MTLGGFSGTILHIDLTHGIIQKEPLDPGMAEGFLGGLGLTVKLAYDRIKIGAQALSPDNLIVLGVGPLVGTNIPATSRVYAVTKLPASGTMGWCGGGGVIFGCLLKNAGYDHVVIEGRAQHPVVLNIVDDDVEICDARDMWGKGVEQTYRMLREDHGMPTGVLSIGQAGENQVSFSMAYIDRFSTLGRGGFGAVWGRKISRPSRSRGPAE
jgi:aldehyde:ferredoxin oxidoreductase